MKRKDYVNSALFILIPIGIAIFCYTVLYKYIGLEESFILSYALGCIWAFCWAKYTGLDKTLTDEEREKRKRNE